jgi:hypothetical protein
MKINVFQYGDNATETSIPNIIYNTGQRNHENVVDILLLTKGDINHFVLIRDISKLLSKAAKFNHNGKMYWCRQCLGCAFPCEEKLKQHYEICDKHEAVRCVLPKAGIQNKVNKEGKEILDKNGNPITYREDELKFKNDGNKFKHPFSVFLDFESTLEKVDEKEKSKETHTIKYQKHIANSCGMVYTCIHEEYNEPCLKSILVIQRKSLKKLFYN